MGQVYKFLGLKVGVIVHGLDDEQRKVAYDADVTYGTNNELGFDYLRDNMKYRMEDMVQRGHIFAIVDEVDSILIDEARTPLIISGPPARNQAEWEPVGRPDCAPTLNVSARTADKCTQSAQARLLSAKPASTFAGRARDRSEF